MLLFPGCKINIGLNIIEKRPDGFHNLESVFFPLNLTDILEIEVSNELKFTCTGIGIPGNKNNNIVLDAYRLLQSRHVLKPVNIHLHKQVPMGAGLGGGSADGAAALLILNDLFDLKISKAYLASMADELGSDCAFFIENKTAMVTGKGENIRPYELDLNGYYIKLINPGIHVNTKDAFNGVELSEAGRINTISRDNIESWKDFVFNDFEKTIFAKYPEIKSLKDILYEQGAIYASLSGTGSTVYGIFKEEPATKMTEHFEWDTKL